MWSNDVDKYATQIYKTHWPNEAEHTGDIRGVNEWDIPDHDLICAGFPCQAFSIAGRRAGFEDTRGTLFFEICRIIKAKRPKLLLLENVKGLLNHDGGRTFSVIIQALDELGYWVEWQVLNSKHFGVPQNRERVFIVGHLRGTGGREIFPITGNDGKDINGKDLMFMGGIESESTKRWLDDGNDFSRNFPQGQRVYSPEGVSSTLSSHGGGLGAKTGLYAIPVLTPDRAEKRQNGRRFKEEGDPAFTVTSQDRNGVAIYNIQSSGRGNGKIERRIRSGWGIVGTGLGGNSRQEKTVVKENMRIRRLTPLECERLQGFPDGWTAGVSDTQRYKCLGNAVTVNVIKFLGELIYYS